MTRTRQATSRLVTAVAGLALIVMALPASAHAPGTERVSLAGVTTLTGSATSVIPVRLPKAAVLADPYSSRGSVSASGPNRFTGFALVSDEKQPKRVLVGGRLPWKISKTLPSATVVIPLSGYPFGGKYEIPAGNYRLYLLTDAKPASIRLKFSGLTGSTTLRPKHRVPSTLTILDKPLTQTPALKNHATMGASAPLRSEGLIFISRLARYSNFVSERVEDCVYERKTTSSDFGPNCQPDGYGAAFVSSDLSSAAAGGAKFDWGGLPVREPGTWGIGFNQQTAGVLEELKYMAFWLNYR